MANPNRGKRTFTFRKHDVIGVADAIDDQKFLLESFVDNGELEVLLDVSDPRCIVTGRTGSGKTALLVMLENRSEKVISIAPGDVALNHIANSKTLRFFADAGVNLDLFYSLLWRHVFAVEIIRERYHIINEQARDGFIARFLDRLKRNKNRQDAINYLVEMGETFWLTSEHRILEVTKTFEDKLQQSLSLDLKSKLLGLVDAGTGGNFGSSETLTTQEKTAVIQYGQPVVQSVQMRKLGQVIEVIESDILTDNQEHYFITIDQLDENWINDDLRYHIIKALIDTVRDFNSRIQNLKIVLAVREDLLERVFRNARSAGYQEEKYKSMNLLLSWKSKDIEKLLDQRISQLVKDQYTNEKVSLRELLPKRIEKGDPVDYIVARTLLRPRDAIIFFNECIAAGEGSPKLTQAQVHQAEGRYSEQRLRAMADEWYIDYPNLFDLAFFLKVMPQKFRLNEFRNGIEDKLEEFVSRSDSKVDDIYTAAYERFGDKDYNRFVREMLVILFRVGIVGIKTEAYDTVRWTQYGDRLVQGELSDNAMVHIHPAFWRVLGIIPLRNL